MNAKELREQFDKDLKALQNVCPHLKKTEWIEQMWAPGHFTGNRVKVCLICEKILETEGTTLFEKSKIKFNKKNAIKFTLREPK